MLDTAKAFGIFLVMYCAARVLEEVVENLTGGEDNFNRLADALIPVKD
jgi:hypothetical protein